MRPAPRRSTQDSATSDRQFADAADHADSLRHADRAARIERIKEVAALQHVIVSGEQREARFFLRNP